MTDLFSRHHKASDIPVWLSTLILRAFSLLPLPILFVIGSCLGQLLFYLHASRRRITLKNLQTCYPQKSQSEINSLTQKHFRYLAYALISTGIGWWGSKNRMRRITHIRNEHELNTLLDEGRNIIFLAPHFTGLEYGGIFLSSERLVVSMYQKNKNVLLDTLIKDHRSRFGAIQYSSKEPVRSMVRYIRDGLPFYYLPDQDPGRKGVFVPFFNISTATFPALGRIAKMSKATVIPCATYFLPWGKGIEIHFLPPLQNYPLGDDEADSSQMNQAIERLIELAPAQYLWSHKRFKTRPEGEPSFY